MSAGMTQARDHPRSRGENASWLGLMPNAAGSSPLTRGKQGPRMAGAYRRGIIPAHAGKTPYRAPSSPDPRDHPRSRGENELGELNQRNARGSSPLTRGKPCSPTPTTPTGGIIPAHAGKTPQTPTERTPRPDHPRSRGENTLRTLQQGTGPGSSPLTRGKPACTIHRAQCIGIIPAHAGKTSPRG